MSATGSSGNSGTPGQGLLGAFGKGSTGLSALQGGATAISILGTLGAAQSKASGLREKAADENLNAQAATASGVGQVAGLRQQLMNTLGERQAMAGAGGVDVGQGVVADTRNAVTGQNDAAASLASTSADIKSRRSTINSISDQIQANDAINAGAVGALGQGLKFLTGLAGGPGALAGIG